MNTTNNLTFTAIAQMLDISAVRAESTIAQIEATAQLALQHQCAAVFALPAHTARLHAMLAGSAVLTGGVVGFPGGSDTTATKVFAARELLRLGCRELDMVNNLTWLKAGQREDYIADIRAVVDAAQGIPVKVILECHWLTDSEITNACTWAVAAGASWVKSSTGWAPSGATAANIALMRQAASPACGIKAAGGIKDLDTLLTFHRAGARRFGVGVGSAAAILAAARQTFAT